MSARFIEIFDELSGKKIADGLGRFNSANQVALAAVSLPNKSGDDLVAIIVTPLVMEGDYPPLKLSPVSTLPPLTIVAHRNVSDASAIELQDAIRARGKDVILEAKKTGLQLARWSENDGDTLTLNPITIKVTDTNPLKS